MFEHAVYWYTDTVVVWASNTDPTHVTIFTFKQSRNTPVKTGDKEGKYKEVENNKQKSKADLKQCWGTTKQNKTKKTK